jgi:hypothetical protein
LRSELAVVSQAFVQPFFPHESLLGRRPSATGYTVVVRYTGDPRALRYALRNQIRSLDPTLAIFGVQTMEEHLRDALFLPRLAGRRSKGYG